MKKMKKIKSIMDQITPELAEEITKSANKKKNVKKIKSQQVNMRLDKVSLERAQTLAKIHNLPYTTFLSKLLCEDLERLWAVYSKIQKKKVS